MSKDVLEKLLERTALFILLVGIALLVLGATSGFQIGVFSLHISEIVWRVVLSAIGLLLVGLAIFSLWKDELKEKPKTSNSSSSSVSLYLIEWDVNDFRKRLTTATDICMIAASNYNLMNDLSEEWREFLKRGGQLRCIYAKRQGKALDMVASHGIGIEGDIKHLKKQWDMTMEAVCDIAKSAPQKNKIQVKIMDYWHGSVLTIIDPSLQSGVAYVTIHGYGQHYISRPSFVLSKAEDQKWFGFFQKTFENMWFSEECESVEL